MKLRVPLELIFALIFAACVLVALFLLAGCGPREVAEDRVQAQVNGQSIVFAADSPAIARLTVERVEAPVERDLVLPGRLTWNENSVVRVYPPVAGRVTRLVARVGDRLGAGQPLCEMASPDFGQAQAEARKAATDLALANQSVERARDLFRHGVASAKDLQQAEADFDRAHAEADRTRERMSAYGPAAGDSGFVLRSPIAGTVVERNVNPGQELRTDGAGAPLFVVADPTRLWIVLDANEADLRALKPGMPLVISSNQFPDESFSGTLEQVSDFVDPATRTVKLRGDVPNRDRTLKAEMFVSARLRLAADQPTVSAKAVYLEGVRHFVFVREDARTFTRKPVRVGPEADGRIPVLSGLKAGDEVVSAGNLLLQQMVAGASRAAPESIAATKP